MAYDFIPKSTRDIQTAKVFLNEHALVYAYLNKKFKRSDPIALSKNPREKTNIKVSRGFQGSIQLPTIKKDLNLKSVNLAFGEGSRGGRGAQNRGSIFEKDLTEDLKTWWADESKYKNKIQ